MSALNIFFRRTGTNILIGRNHHYVHQVRPINPQCAFQLVDRSTLENPMFNMIKVPIPQGTKYLEMDVEFRNSSSQLGWLNPETFRINISNNVIKIQEREE